MDKDKIKQGVQLIIEGIGEDAAREGLVETPDRIARMYEEIFAGLNEDASVHLSKTFSTQNTDMIIEKDITFYSMCEHHFLPFYGKAHIASSISSLRRTSFLCSISSSILSISFCVNLSYIIKSPSRYNKGTVTAGSSFVKYYSYILLYLFLFTNYEFLNLIINNLGYLFKSDSIISNSFHNVAYFCNRS